MASILAGCASPTKSRPKDNPSVDGLILRVDTRGGFLPPGYDLTRIPQFSLYSDGLIVMEGAQIAIYPGPAIPPVFSMRVDEEGLRRIIEAAQEAGMAGADRTYDHPGIADAGTTTFTFIQNDRRHVISAYALGLDDSSSLIPESDRKARSALYELQTKAGNPMGWLPKGSLSGEQRFDYQELAVVVSTDPPGEVLEQPALTWPLSRTIGELARPVDNQPALSCFTVRGEDLSSLRPLVETANELTQWNSGGERHWLRFRPLLPDESGCPKT